MTQKLQTYNINFKLQVMVMEMKLSDKILESAEILNVLSSVLSEQKLTASDKAQLGTALQYLFGAINIINKILNSK